LNISPTQHKILKLLIENEKISMREISEKLSVNMSTVSRNFRSLLESGFALKVEEASPGSSGGRKTALYTANPNKFFVLGIGVEQNRLIGVVIDAKGNEVEKSEIHRNFRGDEIVNALVDCVEPFKEKYPNTVGISIGMPGIIKENKVIFSSALGIEDLDLGGILSREFGTEIFVLNDANAAVVGYGFQKKNVVYFLISVPYYLNQPVGVGAGLWLEGSLYQGSNGAAGEFEIDILPPILSEPATLDEVDLKNLSSDSLLKLLSKLSEVASFVSYLLDPETVIFGGDITLFSPEFHSGLAKNVRDHLEKRHISDVEVLFDERGLWTVAFGAAKAFWKRILEDYEFAGKILK
jgi:predicted NBD/HSP70 family sugar kinase